MTTKKMTLKPLIESVDGVHLTVYLENRGRLTDKKNQLREAINRGEVIVASRSEIPKGHPILAILGDEESEMERSAGFPHFEALHGRFA